MQWSLRQKITLTSIVCLIVPVGLILLFSSAFTKNMVREQAATNALESLRTVRSHISNKISGMIGAANFIMYDSETTAHLKNAASPGNHYQAAVRIDGILRGLGNDNEGMYITLLTADGRYFANYSFYDHNPRKFFEEPWFPQAGDLSAYETFWVGLQDTYLESVRGRYPHMLTFVRALRITAAAKPYAFTIVSLTEKSISGIFHNYAEQNLLLLDADGTVLSAKEGVGTTFPYLNEINESPGGSIVDLGGQAHLIVKERLPYGDWQLVSLIPYHKATSEINRLYRINFLWQLGFFALFLIVLVYLLRQFTKPVVKLGQVAASIEAGNLSIRSHVRGGDEIGRLGKSFDHMLDRVEEMIGQITREQERKRKAELAMLQAQIHPHFLFNILNSIRMRVMLRGDRENADLLGSLSRLLRMTIRRQDELVPLHEEADVAERYMRLMQSTLREPFRYAFQLASDTLLEPVPRFLLQPIIENALVHAFSRRGGLVEIRAWMENGELVVSVRDNGVGMDPHRLRELMNGLRRPEANVRQTAADGANRLSGIGLANVRDRLSMIFGERGRIEIDSEPGRGTVVTIHMPGKEDAQHAESVDRR